MSEQSDVSVMIGVAHIGDFPPKWVDSWTAMVKPEHCTLERIQGRPVDVARNKLVEVCLEKGYDWLLMIDADMCWAPESLYRLNMRNKPLIGALCFTRVLPPTPTTYRGITRVREDGVPFYQIHVEETLEFLEKYQVHLDLWKPAVVLPDCPDALRRYDASGAAFLLIHHEVLEAIEPPWFRYTNPEAMKGEDHHFFRQAKAKGYQLWIDRTVIVGHAFGDQYIGAVDAAAYLQGISDFGLPSWLKLLGRWMRRLGVA